MKALRLLLAAFLALALVPALHAIDVAEPPDFPDTPAAAATYTLTAGTNTFSGTTAAATTDQDYFKVAVPAGMRISQITTSGFGSSFVVPTAPANAGTYTAGFAPGSHFSDINWSIVFTVTAVPDYDVVSSNGVLTITNNTNNNDTLTVLPASQGANIQFAASGRTFSVNYGANSTANPSIPFSGLSSVVINTGSGNETVKFNSFPIGAFPSLTINGGTGADSVAFNGNITFGSGNSLTIDLTKSSAGVVSLNTGVVLNVGPMGSGAVSILCSQAVSIGSGAILETYEGAIDIEANLQSTPTTGNFSGVSLSANGSSGGGIKITDPRAAGSLTVKGRGGNDNGGSQNGGLVTNGAQISYAGVIGNVTVIGVGGASRGPSNFGVAVSQSAAITAASGFGVSVTGTGGASGSSSGVGVSVRSGGKISSPSFVSVNGAGAGTATSGSNHGVLVADTGSLLTSNGYVRVIGTAGPGTNTSYGLDVSSSGGIMSTGNDAGIMLNIDSLSLDANAVLSAPGSLGTVSIAPQSPATQIDIGGAAGLSHALAITNAELARVSTPDIIFSSGDITVSANVTPVSGTNFIELRASGAVHASASGTDFTLGNGTLLLGVQAVPTLACPITSTTVDTGYPQLSVAGNINLSGTTLLDLTGTTLPGTVGNQFTIVTTGGTGTVSGTFNGLAEGAYLVWPGNSAFAAQITYVGGTSQHDVVLTLVPVAQALTVNNTANDTSVGSLQTVLAFAAAHPGADTITFGSGLNGGTITVSGPANGYAITIADSSPVTLDASTLSAGLTISGAGASGNFGLFQVNSGSNLTLRNLTLANGGGSAFTSAGISGGAIANAGTTTLIGCTLTGNSAENGAAIYNVNGATQFTLLQCTLTGNTANSFGGAIISVAPLTVSQCTISGNTARNDGGGIDAASGLNLTNSIVAGNLPGGSGADISAFPFTSPTLTVTGANIVPSLSSFVSITGSGTIIKAAPLLAPLASYGGPTKTMPPLPGSPAIDAGNNAVIPNDPATSLPFTTDQRGFTRISNGKVETSAAVVTNAADDNSATSLRGVIANATDPATTTITFAPALAGSTITLTSVGGQITLGTQGKNFAIDASALPGGLTISGGGVTRLFTASSGTTDVLTGLTLTGGNGGGTLANGSGGAIYNNSAALTLNQCTLINNAATGAGSSGVGGAIRNASVSTGSLTLNWSTVANNAASTTSGSSVGGIACALIPTTINQCTFTGNSTIGVGGALSVAPGGYLAVNESTIAGNNGGSAGGINNSGTTTLTNSIVATNTVNDITSNGTVNSVGTNIVQSISGSYSGLAFVNANPLLAPLGNYGGPTLTMALEPNSPARNAGVVLSPALTSDQRGFPIVGLPDIGAYEAGTLNLNYNAYIYETLPAGTAPAQYAATADYDGDGVSNLNEFLAQTSATDPTRYLHITNLTRAGSSVTITFPAVVGRSYSLQGSSDLSSWTTLAGPFAFTSSGSAMITYGFTSGVPTRYFFRVSVGPAGP